MNERNKEISGLTIKKAKTVERTMTFGYEVPVENSRKYRNLSAKV
jgi:hypothetical protein